MTIKNIAEHLISKAKETPNLPSVICALGKNREGRRAYTIQTFEQLNQESADIAAWLADIGIQKGAKAVLMVRPGPELFAITFGLFKAGIVPILIDPGMDKRDLKGCIAAAAPELFIGISIAHLARILLGWGKKTVKRTIVVGEAQRNGWRGRWWSIIHHWLGDHHLREAYTGFSDTPSHYLAESDPNAVAAILYTSGSTGAPKGAIYRHRHFTAQVELLQSLYPFRRGAFDVPTFPLFALFDPALGMSAVFPIMDYGAPAKADPEEIFAVINDFGAENLFCSPALLRRLSAAVKVKPRSLTLKRIISAGAPVPVEEMETLRASCHQDAEIFTPYGATESLPVSSISCQEVIERGRLGHRRGLGVCVGRPTPGVAVHIIRVNDEMISTWKDAEPLEVALTLGEVITPKNAFQLVGEVVVYGPSTTQGYLAHPQGDRLSKIIGAPPGVDEISGQHMSHRMGDLGYLDQDGFLWLCGRKSHRVDIVKEEVMERWLPHCVEGPLNQLEGIQRTALVANQRGPVVCVELIDGATWDTVSHNIKQHIDKSNWLGGLYGIIQHPSFPVDTRHNAKIKREILQAWVVTHSERVIKV